MALRLKVALMHKERCSESYRSTKLELSRKIRVAPDAFVRGARSACLPIDCHHCRHFLLRLRDMRPRLQKRISGIYSWR